MIWGTASNWSLTKGPEIPSKASAYLICRKCLLADSIFRTNISHNSSIWRALACPPHIIRRKLKKWPLTTPFWAAMLMAQNRDKTVFLRWKNDGYGRKKAWKPNCAWSKVRLNNSYFFVFISPLMKVKLENSPQECNYNWLVKIWKHNESMIRKFTSHITNSTGSTTLWMKILPIIAIVTSYRKWELEIRRWYKATEKGNGHFCDFNSRPLYSKNNRKWQEQ